MAEEEKEVVEETEELDEVIVEGIDAPAGEEETEVISGEEKQEDTEDLKTLKAEIEQLKADKSNLNKALHSERKKAKVTKKDEPESLTRDQLKAILEENDDPETMLRVLEYQAEQVARKISGDAVTGSEMKQKQRDLEKVVFGMYPALADEASELRKDVDDTKSFYGLDGNPFGDVFATGIRVLHALPDMIAAAEERGREEGKRAKADDKRKQTIKDGDLTPGKKKGATAKGLSDTQAEAAKQLNLTEGQLKTYQSLMKSKGQSVQVEE